MDPLNIHEKINANVISVLCNNPEVTLPITKTDSFTFPEFKDAAVKSDEIHLLLSQAGIVYNRYG